MASKGKKRRDARRLRKQRQEESAAVGGGLVEDAAEEQESTPERIEEAPRKQERKKRKKSAGRRFRINGWFIAAPVAIGGVIVIAVLVLTSGSSGVTAPEVEATPDARVAGLTPTQIIAVEAGGVVDNAYFEPSQITGPAGEVFEIVVSNVGSVSHNLTIAGLDDEYGTPDDWSTERAIGEGEQGSVAVKIDEPGTYRFRCALHPLTQTGTLVLQ